MQDIIIFLVFLSLGYVFGKIAEKKNFSSISKREALYLHVPTTRSKHPSFTDKPLARVKLVHGRAVISLDYFKRI